MRIQDLIEFLTISVDERQPLKAIDTNVRNVVMKNNKTRSLDFDKVFIHIGRSVRRGDP
jgi:thioredoxin reductase